MGMQQNETSTEKSVERSTMWRKKEMKEVEKAFRLFKKPPSINLSPSETYIDVDLYGEELLHIKKMGKDEFQLLVNGEKAHKEYSLSLRTVLEEATVVFLRKRIYQEFDH